MLRDRQLKSLKAGPTGLELSFFDNQIREANKDLTEASIELIKTPNPSPEKIADITEARSDFMAEMRRLASVAPRAAVLESFARLEEVLRSSVKVTGQDKSRWRGNISVRNLARMAVEQGLLTPSQLSAFDDVAVVRNVFTHEGAGNIDAARALAYADVIGQLITSITSAARYFPSAGTREDPD
jgi:hypothetical protein